MRFYTALGVVALATAAGAVQFLSSVTLRDRAEPGSWVRFVPQSVALDVGRVELSWPLPQPLLLVAARGALDEGDVDRAEALVARLHSAPDKLALDGRLAQARGDLPSAIRDYLAADDLDDIEARVRSLRALHAFPEALDVQNALIGHLRNDATQRDTLAQAYWVLGGLEEAAAYRFWPTSPKHAGHQAASVSAYASALSLSPSQERYLISYGNQLLNVRRFDDARAIFERAGALDARDSTPLAGLGEAALGSDDRAGALSAFRAANAVNPSDPAVMRLGREIGNSSR